MAAFACEPDKGSEPEVGWRWALEMAKHHELTVVTQTKNREAIERWRSRHAVGHAFPSFSYLELGAVWRSLKYRVPGGMYVYYFLWQWRLAWHVGKLVRSTKFDLMHHVTFASFKMPVGLRGAPVVWGPVGGAEPAPMHLLDGFGTWLGRSRERVRNLSTMIAGKLVRLWSPNHRSGGIALTSTPATSRLLKANGIPYREMPTIGYDSDVLNGIRRYSTAAEPLQLLFVGRLHLLKGVHLLLEALHRLEPGSVVLSIVGDGVERGRLEQQVRDLALAPHVRFCGFVPRYELGDVFASHDVLAAPSLYESGGLAVLEGFAHGLPAIVLDCGGHALSVDGSCGVRIRIDQSQQEVVNGLAGAIQSYCRDRTLCALHGSAARRRLERHYSWDGKGAAMNSIYEGLIVGSRADTSK